MTIRRGWKLWSSGICLLARFFGGQQGRLEPKNGIMVVYFTEKGLAMTLFYRDIGNLLTRILTREASDLVAGQQFFLAPNSLSFEKGVGLCF